MAKDEATVERVAKAIYNEHVKQARASIEKIQFDLADISGFVTKLKGESETAQILIFYSYLDDRIQQLMSQHMVGLDTNASREALFGLNGPLGTFSSRTTVAYHLGWLSAQHCVRLNAFRKVRNEFAHHAFKVSITDPAIADKLKLIEYDLKSMLGSMYNAEEYDLNHFDSILPRIIFLALRTFEELLVRPSAKAHRVLPAHVAGGYDELPDLLKGVVLSMSEALLIAGVKKLPPPASLISVANPS